MNCVPFNTSRAFKRHKLQYSNGHNGALLDANELSSLLSCSLSYAYRIIKKPELLTPHHRFIIDTVLFSRLPGFPPGYSFMDGCIVDPEGYSFTLSDLKAVKSLKSLKLI